MVASLSQVMELIQHFSIFMFGYAFKALGLMKTLGLLGVFIGGNWLWQHSSLITKIVAAGIGG